MARLLLIRHCESVGQEPEAPLTPAGRRQARDLALRLADHPIDLLVASPFRRARETLAPFVEARRLPLRLDPRLRERRIAEPPVPDWRAFVRASFTDPDDRAPGGESGREVLARAQAAIADALASGARLPALATHGHLLPLVLHAMGPGFGYAGWESLANPDLFLVSGASPERLSFERL
jgi:2,3-bisphosphoglycerate-dependent phosphoglycerate mutase